MDIENQNKVNSLYTFISEVARIKKKIQKDVTKEKWTYFLKDILLDNKYIILNYKDNSLEEETFNNKTILEIHKPEFLKPLELKKNYNNWIDGIWEDFNSIVKIKKQIFIEKTIVSEEKKLEIISEIKDIPLEIKEELEKLIEKREKWVQEQKHINKIRLFYEEIFKQQIEWQKNSDNYEILIGNGIIEVEDVYYPMLLKKVNITSDKDIFYMQDSEQPTFIYNDFLNDISDLNLNCLYEAEKKLKEKEIHPLDRNNIMNIFNEIIYKIHFKGKAFFSVEEKEEEKKNFYITIVNNPLFFIRKKDDGIVKAVEDILEDIKINGEIPSHILELTGINNQYNKNLDINETEKYNFNISGENEEILFAKEANREQLRIAERIEKYNAVVVQGPPGTGKTHTIANLLGHFLAQGKNILVTSETKKALEVLKGKIPKNIQDLCVSVLDDDNKDMEKSIDGISEKMGTETSYELIENVKSLTEERKNILKKLNEVR